MRKNREDRRVWMTAVDKNEKDCVLSGRVEQQGG